MGIDKQKQTFTFIAVQTLTKNHKQTTQSLIEDQIELVDNDN